MTLEVRWCPVDQVMETLCGSSHVEVDVSSGSLVAESYVESTDVEGLAAFLGHQRILPPVATNEVWCWDLDSTLRNTRQRHHLLPPNRPEVFENDSAQGWLDYAIAGRDDIPMHASVALYKSMLWQRVPGSYARHHETHIVSGSDDGARGETEAWLRENSLWADVVRLRTGADRRASDTSLAHMKIQYVLDLQARGMKVVGFVEDWAPLAADIEKATGVPVLVVNPMYDLQENRPADNPGASQAVEFAHTGDKGEVCTHSDRCTLHPGRGCPSVLEPAQSETGECPHTGTVECDCEESSSGAVRAE